MPYLTLSAPIRDRGKVLIEWETRLRDQDAALRKQLAEVKRREGEAKGALEEASGLQQEAADAMAANADDMIYAAPRLRCRAEQGATDLPIAPS